jgi:hypothetical protein
MTSKGQAVTNPRISAGATFVYGPRLSWESGVRLKFFYERRVAGAVLLTSANHINAGVSGARY